MPSQELNMLKEGDKAPDFELKDQNGKLHRLADYRGKTVVVYFYPKDDTPGCTKEACSIRDNWAELKKRGIVVLGVSGDNEESHAAFAKKYNLPFPLLADTDRKVINAFGTWGEKSLYGKIMQGILRTTFIIDGTGTIVKVIGKVDTANHAQQIIENLGE